MAEDRDDCSGLDGLVTEIGGLAEGLRERTDPLGGFLAEAADRILFLASMERRITPGYFSGSPLETLRKDNSLLFGTVEGEAYDSSPMNPSVTVPALGREPGQALSFWRTSVESCNHSAFRHDRDRMAAVFGVLPALAGLDGPEGVPGIVAAFGRANMVERWAGSLGERFDPEFPFFRDIIHGADPGDPRYLYRYGSRVTAHDIEMASHVERLPDASVSTCPLPAKSRPGFPSSRDPR